MLIAASMLHPHTKLELIDEHIGYGVVATRRIPAGTITWALDPLDQIIPPSRTDGLPAHLWKVLEHYAYLNQNGEYILCWDFARFMNHSCDPSALAPGVDVEIAVRDIEPGEQITGDYGAYNLERDLACRCGADNCRRTVRRGDFEIYADMWDAKLRAAVARVHEVEQPLWRHVNDTSVLEAAARDPQQLPTCSLHRMAEPMQRAAGHG